MGKTVNRVGTVLEGNFAGKNVYKRDDTSFIIISNDENGKIIIQSLFPTVYSTLKVICKETIASYKLVTGSDVAFYFRDGDKSLVKFYYTDCIEQITRMMFVL